MKKKIFSTGIYKETLRQLSVIGFITLAVCIFASIIPVISGYRDGNAKMVSLSDMNVILCFICQIVSPWMALIAFGYGNKRKKADFYHALPYTRECVFLSIYGAVMTWIGFIIIVSAAISVVGHSMVPSEYIIVYGSVLVELFGMILASALSVSAVSLACALTGTTLMNVLVSALILLVPGIITTVIANVVTAEAPILMGRHLGILSISGYNLYFSSLGRSVFGNGNFGDYGMALVYTLAAALVYGALACVVFKNRKSETAHNSAPTKVLQAIFRILFGFVISLWAVMDMAISGFDASYLIWLALCTIAYFAFELITTKKWKNLIGAIWGWFAVAGMCGISFLLVMLTVNGAYSFQPEAEDIDSVRIVGFGYDVEYMESSQLDFFDYSSAKGSKIRIKNDRVSEIVSEAIKENTGRIGRRWTDNEKYELVSFAVKSGGIDRYRQVYIAYDDYTELVRLLGENEEYKACFTKLPEIRTAAYYYYSMYRQNSFSFDENMYSMMAEELCEVDFFSWHNYLKDSFSDASYIAFVTKEGLDSTTVTFPITIQYLPNTYSYLRNLYMDKQENRDKCIDGIMKMLKDAEKSWDDGTYSICSIDIEANIIVDDHYVPCENSFTVENGEWIEDFGETSSKESVEKLYEILSEVKNMSVQSGSFVEINYQCYDNYKDGEEFTAFFAVPAEYEEYFLSWRDSETVDVTVDGIVEY